MSINDLFKKANILFAEKKYFEGLEVYKDIRLKYPLNTRLYDEINKKLKIHKKPISQSISNSEIEEFFELEKKGHVSIVITRLLKFLEKNKNDVLTISLLGKFLELNGDYEKAILYHKLSIKNAPFELALYLNLSNALKQNNKFSTIPLIILNVGIWRP